MAAHGTVKNIASAWIAKGDREDSIFNKFISYWIAFNAFYSYKTTARRERNCLNEIIADQSFNRTYQTLITQENFQVFQSLILVGSIVNVKNPEESVIITDSSNFNEVINVLYLIRCNLFHGDKGETEARDVQVITAAVPILELVVKALVENHL